MTASQDKAVALSDKDFWKEYLKGDELHRLYMVKKLPIWTVHGKNSPLLWGDSITPTLFNSYLMDLAAALEAREAQEQGAMKEIECPNCGFVFDEETEIEKEVCPICGKLVEDKLSHMRIDHEIKSTADYKKAMKKSRGDGDSNSSTGEAK